MAGVVYADVEGEVTDNLPKSIRHDQMNIAGLVLNVHVLENGQRVIEAEDLRPLIEGLRGVLSDDELNKLVNDNIVQFINP